MDPVMFTLGGISVRWYSVCILIGVIVAYLLAIKEAKKYGIDKDTLFDLAFWIVFIGIIGARTYYVIFNFNEYSGHLLDIFKVWNGGLAIHGGIIAGLITLIIFCKKKHISILRTTDIVSISLLVAQAIGRWGNFFNSEAHGPITSIENLHHLKIIPDFVINGMNIGGVYYHPTFYYESLWCLGGAILFIIIRKYFKYLKKGQLTCLYFMWYGMGRCFIEYLRTDSLMIGPFKVAQLFSIVTFSVAFICFIVIFIYGNKLDKNLYKE